MRNQFLIWLASRASLRFLCSAFIVMYSIMVASYKYIDHLLPHMLVQWSLELSKNRVCNIWEKVTEKRKFWFLDIFVEKKCVGYFRNPSSQIKTPFSFRNTEVLALFTLGMWLLCLISTLDTEALEFWILLWHNILLQ